MNYETTYESEPEPPPLSIGDRVRWYAGKQTGIVIGMRGGHFIIKWEGERPNVCCNHFSLRELKKAK